MPIVTFLPSRKTVEVPVGTTLFEAAALAAMPVASSCQAELVCGKCHMALVAGSDQVSPLSPEETKVLLKERVPAGERLSCVTRIQGDVTVKTSYW